MNQERENIRRLAAELGENLAKCAADPEEDPVHDTRTGTRRLQATVEALLREIPPGEDEEAVHEAARPLLRLLRKERRAAGPVRDLDVHRTLLEKLTRRASGGAGDEPEAGESGAAGDRSAKLREQAEELDAWLKHRRDHLAEGLRARAKGAAGKLEERVGELESALIRHAGRKPRREQKSPAVVALDAFARLALRMPHLDTGNLHDFRKGAKKARYVAELADEGDEEARQVGRALKKLQDEIGDWHDWLVLSDEAGSALAEEAAELRALIDGERDAHFMSAMKTAAQLRGRLMGEWLAVHGKPPGKRPGGAAAGGALKRRIA